MPPKAAFNYNETKLKLFMYKLQNHINAKYHINIKWHPKQLDKKLYTLLQQSKKEQANTIRNAKEKHTIKTITQHNNKKHYQNGNNNHINQHEPNLNPIECENTHKNPVNPPHCNCNHNGCEHHQLIKRTNKGNSQINATNTNINILKDPINNNPIPTNPHNISAKLNSLRKPNHISIINKERIEQTIEKLVENAGQPGIDAIPIEFYFWSGTAMTDTLNNYYKILETINIFPSNMKTDIKTPLPKYKADAADAIKQDPSQYRPIACQNIIYKILDGNLKMELEKHDKTHKIIERNQGGFKKEQETNEHTWVLQNIFCYNPKKSL